MGLIGSLDRTLDAATVWDSSESVTNNSTGASSAFEVGPSSGANLDGAKHGELFQARFTFTTCSVATNDMVVLNVQGSNVADFSEDVYNLGSLAVGAAVITNTNIGVVSTQNRGVGVYVLPFYNIGLFTTTLTGQQQQACRFVRIQTKTIGATSACAFSVRIEKI
jgi:hypothetical protein